MRRSRRRAHPHDPSVQLVGMIDVVFVLLTYFMLCSSFEKPESELAFRLPGAAQPGEALNFPDEQIVELTEAGQPVLNERALDAAGAPAFRELESVLSRFREASTAAKSTAALTLAPHERTPHQAVVRALDAANRAGITDVRFALGGAE